MHVFLDDERLPEHITWINLPKANWVICRTPDEFLHVVSTFKQKIKHISFDNDLGFEKEGYHLLQDICDMDIDNNGQILNPNLTITAHTQNVVNREPILQYFRNYMFHKNGS